MENQILVKARHTTRSFLDAAPTEKQIEVAEGAIGVLIGLETHGDDRIAWVLWDQANSSKPTPVLTYFIEAVGVRMGKYTVVVE